LRQMGFQHGLSAFVFLAEDQDEQWVRRKIGDAGE